MLGANSNGTVLVSPMMGFDCSASTGAKATETCALPALLRHRETTTRGHLYFGYDGDIPNVV
jgi:hypothetical protein